MVVVSLSLETLSLMVLWNVFTNIYVTTQMNWSKLGWMHYILDCKHDNDSYSYVICHSRENCCSTNCIYPFAMWSMDGVNKHYLIFEKAGYQYLEQVITGMDCKKVTFASTLQFLILQDLQRKIKLFDQIMLDIMGGRGRIIPNIFHIFKMWFSLLCCDEDFLKMTLHNETYLQSLPFSFKSL